MALLLPMLSSAPQILAAGATNSPAGTAVPLNREVLALFDSREEGDAVPIRIAAHAEMPLNHLGYRVTYWDLKRGMPDAATTKRFKAVVTWFGGRVHAPRDYLTWATRTAQSGTRFIIFGSIGVGFGEERTLVDGFLNELGFAATQVHVDNTARSQIVTRDASMLDFERKLSRPWLPYDAIISRSSDVRAHLSVSDPAFARRGPEAMLVATGPRGSYVANGYSAQHNPADNRYRWLIDPFAFFKAALSDGISAPIPDTTTVSGRRIYFSHIDGDGWNNLTKVAPEAIASEIVSQRLIEPYPDLPVSIGLISCDIDLALSGHERADDVARALFAMKQVEVASHTHSHPFNWSFFSAYSRAKEMALLKPPAPRMVPRVIQVAGEPSLFGSAPTTRTIMVPQPAAPASEAPRAMSKQPFDLNQEVAGSLAIAQSLAPEGKKAALYLWSGNTRPFEAAIRATRKAGVRNLNGGDSRFDPKFPSVNYVPPISRMVGAERQIYAVNSNEFTYTNDWKGPFDGFKDLKQTLDRTENPRRLKGFNVYYHMYSAERPESLAAVKTNLDLARASAVTPIKASEYAAIADSFFEIELVAKSANEWRVRNRGDLKTLRFDDADALTVDYAASQGVLGHNRHAKSLYVALDPAVAEPVLAVRPAKPAAATPRAHLIESRWQFSKLSETSCGFKAETTGFGPGQMSWGGLKPGRYRLAATGPDTNKSYDNLTVGADGILKTVVEADARSGLKLEISCAQ